MTSLVPVKGRRADVWDTEGISHFVPDATACMPSELAKLSLSLSAVLINIFTNESVPVNMICKDICKQNGCIRFSERNTVKCSADQIVSLQGQDELALAKFALI